MKPRPTRMVSTSWRNSSLSNWRHCTFPHSVQCSTSSPRNMSIAWMSSFTSRCRSRVKWIHCAGVPRHKIRAESSSNGSELRSAGFTPHKIRAELSSNGSSRPASDKKIRAESSSNGSCRVSFGQFAGVDAHSSSLTLAFYEPHEGLSPRPLGLRHCVRRQCVYFSL